MTIRQHIAAARGLVVKPRNSDPPRPGRMLWASAVQMVCAAVALVAAFAAAWSGWAEGVAPLIMLCVLLMLAESFAISGESNSTITSADIFFVAGIIVLPPAHAMVLIAVSVLWGVAMQPTWAQSFTNAGSRLFSQSIALALTVHAATPVAPDQLTAGAAGLMTAVAIVALRSAEYIAGLTYCSVVPDDVAGVRARISRGTSAMRTVVPAMASTAFATAPLAWIAVLLSAAYPLATAALITPFVVAWRAARHELQLIEVRRRVKTDSLTGLYNRTGFFEHAEQEIAAAQRYGHHVALIMGDLDNFKRVNDTLGHLAGDDVIRVTGSVIRESVDQDRHVCGRYGGEEFAILTVTLSLEAAVDVAEQIRRAVERELADTYGTSISLGVAQECPGDSFEDLIGRADKALYAAKLAGKNRVIAYGEEHDGRSASALRAA